MVVLSLNTGMRRGEVFKLNWADIDINPENPSVTVRGTNAKSGKSRTIPLPKDAVEALTVWRSATKDPSGLVFPGPTGKEMTTVKTAWATVCKSAEIDDFRWHDLRHTYASYLSMKGVDLNTIRELMGHSDYKMTLIYAHLAPTHKSKAVRGLFKFTAAPLDATDKRASLAIT